MNIKKENIPVLVAIKAYVGAYNNHSIFSVYLEKDAFWKISCIDENDMVIYTTEDNWNPKVVSGQVYQQMTIQHNNQLLVLMSPLDKVERKYLEGIIEPFRNRVDFIMKDDTEHSEYILIYIKRDVPIMLPYFAKGAMYTGMEIRKKYTLDELDL